MRRALVLLTAVLALGVLVGRPAAHSADDWTHLFNGKNLDGWEGLKELWKMETGAVVGSSHPDGLKFNTFLISKKKYKDFELKFQVRLKDGKGNSGVQIRSEILNQEKLSVRGPQVDIATGYWGSLYGEQFGGMMKAAPRDQVDKVVKKDDFNEVHIVCKGKRVTIKVNGVITVDQEFDKLPDEGVIAWQLHSGGPMEVTFRNIEFKDLSAK